MRGGRLGSFWSEGPEVSFLAFLLSFFVDPSSLPRLVVARNWGRFCIGRAREGILAQVIGSRSSIVPSIAGIVFLGAFRTHSASWSAQRRLPRLVRRRSAYPDLLGLPESSENRREQVALHMSALVCL